MIDLQDIRYVRLGTRDLAAATRYATEVVGLQAGDAESGARYFRSDGRDHTLVYFEGEPTDHTVGFEVRDMAALDHAAAHLESLETDVRIGSAGECEQRRVRAFINFRDPTGNSIDLVVNPLHSGRRAWLSHDAGITDFSHIGLRSSQPARDEKFWTGVMGARVSDRIGEAALLRIDEVHHKLALFPSDRPGVQHINHQVQSVDDVMRAYYRLKESGVRIVFGPGRHPTSGATFLYFEGPDGMVYEYSTGVSLIAKEDEATHRPRQFPAVPSSFCMWGSRPDIPEFK
jgi:2,3-dihydroxy-p-cumate/2,3-dihydroxybenzoate 3,4-dioxygenase